jgi:hypothetical protein
VKRRFYLANIIFVVVDFFTLLTIFILFEMPEFKGTGELGLSAAGFGGYNSIILKLNLGTFLGRICTKARKERLFLGVR